MKTYGIKQRTVNCEYGRWGLYEGDIETLAINPFEIYPDSLWYESVAIVNLLSMLKHIQLKKLKIYGE